MTDYASPLFHLSDTQFLSHISVSYPHMLSSWQISPLTQVLISWVISTLRRKPCKRALLSIKDSIGCTSSGLNYVSPCWSILISNIHPSLKSKFSYYTGTRSNTPDTPSAKWINLGRDQFLRHGGQFQWPTSWMAYLTPEPPQLPISCQPVKVSHLPNKILWDKKSPSWEGKGHPPGHRPVHCGNRNLILRPQNLACLRPGPTGFLLMISDLWIHQVHMPLQDIPVPAPPGVCVLRWGPCLPCWCPNWAIPTRHTILPLKGSTRQAPQTSYPSSGLKPVKWVQLDSDFSQKTLGRTISVLLYP